MDKKASLLGFPDAMMVLVVGGKKESVMFESRRPVTRLTYQ